jgi:hypothetical protein
MDAYLESGAFDDEVGGDDDDDDDDDESISLDRVASTPADWGGLIGLKSARSLLS